MPTFFDFEATRIDGKTQPFSEWRGDVVLVVNTASLCGFTPQLAGLQALWLRYRADGLKLVGFPCNQFRHQEPSSDSEIGAFCEGTFGTSFPLMSKIDVNGEHAHPLFLWLAAQAPGILGTQRIKWNFTKFLVNRRGEVVRRYAPLVAPESLSDDIQLELQKPIPTTPAR